MSHIVVRLTPIVAVLGCLYSPTQTQAQYSPCPNKGPDANGYYDLSCELNGPPIRFQPRRRMVCHTEPVLYGYPERGMRTVCEEE